jgi:hypothetical protein
MGQDVDGACGQLALKYSNQSTQNTENKPIIDIEDLVSVKKSIATATLPKTSSTKLLPKPPTNQISSNESGSSPQSTTNPSNTVPFGFEQLKSLTKEFTYRIFIVSIAVLIISSLRSYFQ